MAEAEVTQRFQVTERLTFESPPAVELDLKGLNFKDRWEVIGQTNPNAYLRAPAPECPLSGWRHDRQTFVGIVGSTKLSNCENSRRSAARLAGTQPADPADTKRQNKYLREAGSPFRVHCSRAAGEQYQNQNGAIPRDDYIGKVDLGMTNMLTRWEQRFGAGRLRKSKSQPSFSHLGRALSNSPTKRGVTDPKAQSSDSNPMNETIVRFRRWCKDTYGSVEMAWDALSDGLSEKSEDEFISMLALRGYKKDVPDATTRRQLCKDLVTYFAEGGFVDRAGFLEAVDAGRKLGNSNRSPGRRRASQIDLVESMATGADRPDSNGRGQSSLENKREEIIARLRKNDAMIAEIIAYFFKNFGTLKLAFKSLDINANGSLSTQEFVDGVTGMRSRKSAGPIEEHISAIFSRIDSAGAGGVPLQEFLVRLEKDTDPMSARLWKFLNEAKQKKEGVTSKRRGSVSAEEKAARGDASMGQQVANVKMRIWSDLMKVGGADSVVTCNGFIHALEQLKYPVWHSKDLFKRLDVDDSGELSLAEFTAFLQKNPPSRTQKLAPLSQLGTDERQNKVDNMYMSSAHSTKLQPVDLAAKAVNGHLEKLMARGHPEGAKWLQESEKQDKEGRIDRPDWPAAVEDGLAENREEQFGSRNFKPKPTELARLGKHVVRVHASSMPELLDRRLNLVKFNEHEQRSRSDVL